MAWGETDASRCAGGCVGCCGEGAVAGAGIGAGAGVAAITGAARGPAAGATDATGAMGAGGAETSGVAGFLLENAIQRRLQEEDRAGDAGPLDRVVARDGFIGRSGLGLGEMGGGAGAGGTSGELLPARASTFFSISINSCASLLKRRSEMSMALRRESGISDAGSNPASGMTAPPTRTGMTRSPNSNAVATSTRTLSSGLSRCLDPFASLILIQLGPSRTRTTSHSASVRAIASTVFSVPNRVDVHEDVLMAECIDQPVMELSRIAGRIRPPV